MIRLAKVGVDPLVYLVEPLVHSIEAFVNLVESSIDAAFQFGKTAIVENIPARIAISGTEIERPTVNASRIVCAPQRFGICSPCLRA